MLLSGVLIGIYRRKETKSTNFLCVKYFRLISETSNTVFYFSFFCINLCLHMSNKRPMF